jgi:hypothetical protein
MTHRGQRSFPKLLLRLKRHEILLARKKAHSFLYNTSYYDDEKAETVAMQNVEVPNIVTKITLGVEVECIDVQAVERGDIIKDSRGQGCLQNLVPQTVRG